MHPKLARRRGGAALLCSEVLLVSALEGDNMEELRQLLCGRRPLGLVLCASS